MINYDMMRALKTQMNLVGSLRGDSPSTPNDVTQEIIDNLNMQDKDSGEIHTLTISEIQIAMENDYIAMQENYVRNQRNLKLAETDWTQLPDVIIQGRLTQEQVDAFVVYRQELADITNQTGFPNNVTWPTKPSV